MLFLGKRTTPRLVVIRTKMTFPSLLAALQHVTGPWSRVSGTMRRYFLETFLKI